MAKIKRVMRCNHCGAILQNDSSKLEGYTKNDITTYSSGKVYYCDRCYEALDINFSSLNTKINEEISTIIEDAIKTESLIVLVLDIFSFNGSLKEEFVEKLEGSNLLVVGNKKDLFFGKDGDDDTIKRQFSMLVKEAGLKPQEVILTSASQGKNIDSLINAINKLRGYHDVYILGPYFSGKSSLVACFLETFKNKTKRNIITKHYGKTGVRVLSIPLDSVANLYEIPDISTNDISTLFKGSGFEKYVIPDKKTKEKRINLMKGQGIMFGGVCCISLEEGKNTDVTYLISDKLSTRKISSNKFLDIVKINLVKKDLLPCSERLTTFKDFDMFEYDMEKDKKTHTISIMGLCWISFKAEGQRIRIQSPKGVAIKEFKSSFKD